MNFSTRLELKLFIRTNFLAADKLRSLPIFDPINIKHCQNCFPRNQTSYLKLPIFKNTTPFTFGYRPLQTYYFGISVLSKIYLSRIPYQMLLDLSKLRRHNRFYSQNKKFHFTLFLLQNIGVYEDLWPQTVLI